MELKVNLKENSYSIILGNNILKNINNYYSLNCKVLIVTDDNIPSLYSDIILNLCKEGYKFIVENGEKSKSIDNYCLISKFLLDHNFSKSDLIIAVGGGVVGDLSAFVASTYKRGIDFINIPTSTLAMIDSSVGGKTAIDFNGVKNSLGTFYQPKLVLIDFDVLKTLDRRNFNNGFVEALKMGLILDKEIIKLFNDLNKNKEEIIIKSLKAKIKIIEKDEKEKDIRKILNFGHTLGHAFEASISSLLHGEAIGKGMLYFLKDDLKVKIKEILKDLNIPLNYNYDINIILDLIKNDKKIKDDYIEIVIVENIGQAIIKKMTIKEIIEKLKEGA